jgi:hypothetical protein
MTIQNTARTRRGLRRIIEAADQRIAELEKDNAYKTQGLSKPDVDEMKLARDWLNQEAQEPEKKDPNRQAKQRPGASAGRSRDNEGGAWRPLLF